MVISDRPGTTLIQTPSTDKLKYFSEVIQWMNAISIYWLTLMIHVVDTYCLDNKIGKVRKRFFCYILVDQNGPKKETEQELIIKTNS